MHPSPYNQNPPLDSCRPRETSGPTPGTAALMAARTLESHGAFVQPWLRPGMDVLDLGCGPGTITLGLAEAVLPGRVTGIDTAPGAIETAQRLAAGLERVNTTFRTANAYELPFEDNSFDLVFSHALFEHLSRPLEVMNEIQRVLRPGGLAALCSMDWNQTLIAPDSPSMGFALEAHRSFMERNGGCTEAGSWLAPWSLDAGLDILESDTHYEMHDHSRNIAEYFALQLEHAGIGRHAESWRNWSLREGATFAQAWGHVIARKNRR